TINISNYMDAVEDGTNSIRGIEYLKYHFGLFEDKVTPNDLISVLPDIKHFVKHGHECATKCGVECNYCELCAKRTENFLFS
ncbi:hypothetical protein IJ531_04120, partial [bacterium]|nr:hypothetical protein [bacterium]